MKSYLLTIGQTAEQALPVIVSSFAACAAGSVPELSVLHVSSRSGDDSALTARLKDLNGCRPLFASVEDLPLFRTEYSYERWVPAPADPVALSSCEEDALLLSALRGRGIPLSYKTDRDALEWAFSVMLSDRPDSCEPLNHFVSGIRDQASAGEHTHLALLCDPAECFSAAAALSLLPWLRKQIGEASVDLSVIALAASSSPLPARFMDDVSSFLSAVEDRSLLRVRDSDPVPGADAMWLISLPSSMCDHPDAHRLTALAAARTLSLVFRCGRPPVPGFHTISVSGVLSLYSLGNESVSFTAFLECSCWLLTDVIPAVRSWLAHTGRSFPLAVGGRNSLLRRLFPRGGSADVAPSLDLMDRTLRAILKDVVLSLESIPEPLCFSDGAQARWKEASDALGRYITVVSELDVTRGEVHESGIDTIRPVHRESLSDTEEEKLLRRIDDIARQAEDEKAKLDRALEAVGPFRAAQAGTDCLRRCRDALEGARNKLSGMSADTEEHLTIARQERRVRLLEAAVRRCETELSAANVAPSDITFSPDTPRPAAGILSASGMSSLKAFLADSASEAAVKSLRDQLPSLPDGYTLPDSRALFRSLQQALASESEGPALNRLLTAAWQVCADAASSLRFLSRGILPDVPLLPDLIPASAPIRISDLLPLFPGYGITGQASGDMRGLLAMLILRQYRRRQPDEARLSAVRLTDSTPLLRAWLSSEGSDTVWVLSLETAAQEGLPFALVVPGRRIIPAHRLAAHSAIVPAFAWWFDRSAKRFSDPGVFLSEGDRTLLLSRISQMLYALSAQKNATALSAFLTAWQEDLQNTSSPEEKDSHLKTRIQAVCGLRMLPAYEGSLRKVQAFYEHFLTVDQVGACITGDSSFPASSCTDIPEDVVYSWRGIPFARENAKRILEKTHAPEEDYILSVLSSECGTLSGISDDYRDALHAEIPQLLERFPDALEERRKTAESLLEEASRPLSDRVPELSWPWDPLSPSILTVLRECLDTDIADAAVRPFPEKIVLFPARGGEIIGDSLLNGMCTVVRPAREDSADDPEASAVPSDTVIPPLSDTFAAALCFSPQGRILLTPDLIRIEHTASSSLRVTLTLNGRFPMRLVRSYSEEEIVTLYSHDIPTLAVWPSVPIPAGMWNAYFIYANQNDSFEISMLGDRQKEPVLLTGDEARRTVVLPDFPACFFFRVDGMSAGSLPNILPEPMIPDSGPRTACVDFGSVCTSVIFSDGASRSPLNGPVMVRTLISNPSASRDLLRKEFLPAVPVTALLPTVTRIFRNVPGARPEPFSDGIILMTSDLEDILSTPSGAVYTCLKWEEEKGRSGFLCLHQVLLMAALQARLEGASELRWRFSLPDGMAPEGREYLAGLFRSITDRVFEESGFVPPRDMPVAFASDSTALGAYFRCCASEDTRGGFMVLDIGACTADISLFLRGKELAVRSCQIPLGVHYLLLPSLLDDPYMLQREFGTVQDERFIRDLSLLTHGLSLAGTDPVALRRTRIALDHFIADYAPLLLSAMLQMASAGYPTRFGAILLLGFSYLMMLSGLVLLQIAADPNKNDFLPEQMSLCLAGRGASLPESLPPQLKESLWHFLTMFRNRRVASISLLFSAEKKLEIPVGLSMLKEVTEKLPPVAPVPASVSVRPEELLPEFLLKFRKEYPASASLLFPGFFTNDFYHSFSPYGENVMAAATDESFRGRDVTRPYDALAAWIGNVLDILRSKG